MKINYTMFGTELTGGARVLLEIANGLVDRGNDVTITSAGCPGDHKWFPLKAKTHYVHKTVLGKLFFFGLNYGFRKMVGVDILPHYDIRELAVKTPDCDINVATYCFTAFAVFRSGKGVPFYHMQHYEPLFFDDPHLRKASEETYYLPLRKIVNSAWLKNQMKERYGHDLPIVNPGIDHNVFYPRNVNRNESKSTILCFSRKTRWKGFADALEAMRIVMKGRNDVKFVAFGKEQPIPIPDVPYEFIRSPSDDELARLYSSTDIVICPSWYESFPLYPLESMACGTPIITTPYGTEDYAFHEKNCLIVPPRNPTALANAVLRLLDDEDLREHLSKEGPKTARQFTWDKTVDKIERLFRETARSG